MPEPRCDTAAVFGEFDARLRRFVRARVRDRAAADDVLQEVYVRVHSHLDSVRDCSRLSAWLHQVARNAIADHFRGRRAEVEVPEDLPAPVDEGDDDVLAELAAGLGGMVASLPARYREALELTLREGLTQEQIAARLGLSLSGAKSRVQRGRDRLKALLLECCHFELDRYGHVIHYEERCCCCAATGTPPARRGARR